MNTPDREVFEHWFATEQMPGSELSYDNRRALISIYANENGYSGDYSDLHKAWTIWNAAFKLQATSAQPQQVDQAQIPHGYELIRAMDLENIVKLAQDPSGNPYNHVDAVDPRLIKNNWVACSDRLDSLRNLLNQRQAAINAGCYGPTTLKSETLPADKITVSKEPLKTMLTALVSDGHFIRELQATRLPSAIFPDNPINVLVAEFNASEGR